ncbi:MAG TPA: rod shape-determining protein RodA, partial [Pelagibacterales bacterium]|nr:rod shape-determining protein RodA [Pelagibacterales bacterium]
MAKFLSDRRDNKNQFITIILTLIVGLIPAILVFGQPDLGTAI